jgi:hypothetical protein
MQAETMKVKIHGPEREWGVIRQGIFWMVFCILLILASFESGWILRNLQIDDTQKRVLKLENKFTDHDGRITVLEGRRPGFRLGFHPRGGSTPEGESSNSEREASGPEGKRK